MDMARKQGRPLQRCSPLWLLTLSSGKSLLKMGLVWVSSSSGSLLPCVCHYYPPGLSLLGLSLLKSLPKNMLAGRVLLKIYYLLEIAV